MPSTFCESNGDKVYQIIYEVDNKPDRDESREEYSTPYNHIIVIVHVHILAVDPIFIGTIKNFFCT